MKREFGRIFENHAVIRDLVTSGAARDVTAGNVDADDRCVRLSVCLSAAADVMGRRKCLTALLPLPPPPSP